MAILKKVRSGEPLAIDAGVFNAMLDSTDKSRRHQLRQGAGPAASRFQSNNVILIENKSEQAVDRFGILGLGDPLFTPEPRLDSFLNQIAFVGELPAADDHAGKFAITLEPIRKDAIGRAYISGVCPCLIDVVTEGDPYADIIDDDVDKLQSSDSGNADILWVESGTGTLWAIIRFGGPAKGTYNTPYEMLPAVADIETETPQTDTWDRSDSPEDTDGVIYRGPRVVYDDTSDEVLYMFTRDVTYDSAGCLAAISAETQHTIDTPEECP